VLYKKVHGLLVKNKLKKGSGELGTAVPLVARDVPTFWKKQQKVYKVSSTAVPVVARVVPSFWLWQLA